MPIPLPDKEINYIKLKIHPWTIWLDSKLNLVSQNDQNKIAFVLPLGAIEAIDNLISLLKSVKNEILPTEHKKYIVVDPVTLNEAEFSTEISANYYMLKMKEHNHDRYKNLELRIFRC